MRRRRKAGKAKGVRRRRIESWRRTDANRRTDDERFSDGRYFGVATSPVVWLARRAADDLRHIVTGGEVTSPEELLGLLRADALDDAERVRATRPTFLRDARGDYTDFLSRLERHWQSALDMLEVFTWNSIEVIAQVQSRIDGSGVTDTFSTILLRLAGRATRIAREVAWLLRGGYPEAALGRWRTLYEIAVTMTYVRVHGPTSAERILYHEVLQTLDFNERQRTGHGGVTALGEEYEREQDLKRQLLAKYGPDFANRYGWSADVVGKARPTFKDIELAAGMSDWRLAYEDATYSAHSTPRPLHEEGFMRHGRDVLAPTVNGLASPAIMTIRTLLQADCALLGVVVRSIEDLAADLKTAMLLDAIAREAMDSWASHEWDWRGLKHIPG